MLSGSGNVGHSQLFVHVHRLAGVLAPLQCDLVAPGCGIAGALVVLHVTVAEDLHAVVILFRIQRQIALVGVLRDRLEERRGAQIGGRDLIDLVPDIGALILSAGALQDKVAFVEETVEIVLLEEVPIQQVADQIVRLRLGRDARKQAERH